MKVKTHIKKYEKNITNKKPLIFLKTRVRVFFHRNLNPFMQPKREKKKFFQVQVCFGDREEKKESKK
jgi:hypothetical protein